MGLKGRKLVAVLTAVAVALGMISALGAGGAAAGGEPAAAVAKKKNKKKLRKCLKRAKKKATAKKRKAAKRKCRKAARKRPGKPSKPPGSSNPPASPKPPTSPGPGTSPTPSPTASPTPSASATPTTPAGGAQSAKVDIVAGQAFKIVFTADRAAGAAPTAATGDFRADFAPGGVSAGFFAGPVTCLSVVGDDVGIFYKITESSPPGANMVFKGAFVSVKLDGMGMATMAGFQPTPMETAESCDPADIPMALPASGSATATGG